MSELSPSNYIRISVINWVLSVPLIVMFAWPYYYAAKLTGMLEAFRYIGAFLFAVPFMLTIIHGHVTMALGSVHRQHYYQWLIDKPYSFGLFYNNHGMIFVFFNLIEVKKNPSEAVKSLLKYLQPFTLANKTDKDFSSKYFVSGHFSLK